MIVTVVKSGTNNELAIPPDKQAVLWGFSTAESAYTAATAELVLRHGSTATAPMLVAPINFAADGFGYPTFFPVPMPVPNGVYVNRVSGDTTVVLYWDRQ